MAGTRFAGSRKTLLQDNPIVEIQFEFQCRSERRVTEESTRKLSKLVDVYEVLREAMKRTVNYRCPITQ